MPTVTSWTDALRDTRSLIRFRMATIRKRRRLRLSHRDPRGGDPGHRQRAGLPAGGRRLRPQPRLRVRHLPDPAIGVRRVPVAGRDLSGRVRRRPGTGPTRARRRVPDQPGGRPPRRAADGAAQHRLAVARMAPARSDGVRRWPGGRRLRGGRRRALAVPGHRSCAGRRVDHGGDSSRSARDRHREDHHRCGRGRRRPSSRHRTPQRCPRRSARPSTSSPVSPPWPTASASSGRSPCWSSRPRPPAPYSSESCRRGPRSPEPLATRPGSRPVPIRPVGTRRPTSARLVRLDRAAVWRAVSLRRGILLLAFAPGLIAFSGDLKWELLTILPGLVTSGAALLFGVNAWCLDGRGALWRDSLPADPSVAFAARTLVLLELLLVSSAASLLLPPCVRARPQPPRPPPSCARGWSSPSRWCRCRCGGR